MITFNTIIQKTHIYINLETLIKNTTDNYKTKEKTKNCKHKQEHK